MKKIFAIFILILCIFGLYAKSGLKMYVSVEEASLKDKPSFFGKNVNSVFYGEEVIILDTKGSWIKIQLSGNNFVFGWISESSLTKKKIVSTGSKVTASAEEIALAGKGFNAEIESEYKKQGTVNYEAVDKLEEKSVSFENSLDFMIDGKLENSAVEGE